MEAGKSKSQKHHWNFFFIDNLLDYIIEDVIIKEIRKVILDAFARYVLVNKQATRGEF